MNDLNKIQYKGNETNINFITWESMCFDCRQNHVSTKLSPLFTTLTCGKVKSFKHLKTKVLTTVLARSCNYMLNDLIDIKPHSTALNGVELQSLVRHLLGFEEPETFQFQEAAIFLLLQSCNLLGDEQNFKKV